VTSQSYFGPPSQRPFGSFYGYDVAGRVKQSYQRIDGADYGITNIIYNRADEQTEVTYPSARRVTTAYDGAGRIASLSTIVGGATTNLSSAIAYSPAGALTSEVYGNYLTHAISYNSRFQPTSIRLGADGSASVFELTYLYGKLDDPNGADTAIDGAKNNDNIARTRLFWDGVEQYAQTYQYDALNRLQYYVLHAYGVIDPANEYLWETYEYDRFGNRGMNNSASTSWGPPLSYFNPANNRINSSVYQYDSKGNLKAEPLPGGTTIAKSYTYNAENKITSFNGGTNQYDYDGDGRRVKIKDGFNRTTRMVYDAGGKLIAEYDAGNGSLKKEYFYRGGELLATIEADGTVKFGTADHLGSVREWTDIGGSLVLDGTHDYTPFGMDIYYGEQRDGQRQQFTGKERDNETGLDYFLARYFSSVQGRFTSPDEFKGGPHELWVLGSRDPEQQALVYADITNPQSLNKYQYCFNNPLKYVDPDGHQEEVWAHYAELRRQLAEGKITQEEYQRRINEFDKGFDRGIKIGLGVVAAGVAAYYAPRAASAILGWALRNPATVQQIGQEAVQMSTGNPGLGPPGTLTLATKTGLRAAEIASGTRLAKQIGGRLVESTHIGADFVDAVTKKTYDVMGAPNAYKYFGSGKEFFDSILHHVNKSVNHVVIDLKGASKQQIEAIQRYVGGLTKEQRDKIIYLSP
jgi:RHS repeat-associated protein